MIPFESLPPIYQDLYLLRSSGTIENYPNDFIYESTLEGHNFWWAAISGDSPTIAEKTLRKLALSRESEFVEPIAGTQPKTHWDKFKEML